jgi:hypothetical protein
VLAQRRSWTISMSEEQQMARGKPTPADKPRSENRRLTEAILVRFTNADKLELAREAERRGMTIPELLREAWFSSVRAAS